MPLDGSVNFCEKFVVRGREIVKSPFGETSPLKGTNMHGHMGHMGQKFAN